MAKHNFAAQGPLSRYNAQGEVAWAHSEEELARITQEGFRSSYVRSKYPTTAFNKKTGASKPVGKLGDTDEQVAAKVAAFGPDWTLEHVPEPEPVVANKTAEASGGADTAMLMQLIGQNALIIERLSTVETALVQSADQQTLLASRLGELGGMIQETEPAPVPSKPVPAKELVGAGKK